MQATEKGLAGKKAFIVYLNIKSRKLVGSHKQSCSTNMMAESNMASLSAVILCAIVRPMTQQTSCLSKKSALVQEANVRKWKEAVCSGDSIPWVRWRKQAGKPCVPMDRKKGGYLTSLYGSRCV